MRILRILAAAVLLVPAAAGAAETARRPEELQLPPLAFSLPPLAVDTLECGIVLRGRESHDTPLVTVVAVFRAGRRYVPGERFAAMDLLGPAWSTGGTESLDPDAYDRRLAALDARIHVGVGSRSGHVELNCVREDLEEALAVWGDLILRPRFDAERLERARGKALQEIQALNDSPERVAAQWFRWLASGRDYPGARVLGRAEVAAVGPEDLRHLHGAFVHPENLVLGVSGDYDPAAIGVLLDGIFAEWKGEEGYAPPVLQDWPVEPSRGVFLVPEESAQSHVHVGHRVSGLDKLSADYAASQIWDFAVGYGRVFYRSREEGLSYGATVYLGVGSDDAYLDGMGSCRPEVTGALARVLLDELQRVREEPLDDGELETSRAFRVGLVISRSEVPRRLIRSRLVDLVEGRPDGFLADHLRRLQRCDTDDLERFAESRLLPPEEMVVLVLGDSAKVRGPLEELGLGPVRTLQAVRFGE